MLAYEFLKKQLLLLQWQKRSSGQQGDRWALKAPHHLHFIDLLFKVFPDARVVQTHRDPLEAIPSLASFVYSFQIIASDDADAAEVGRHWARKFANGMCHTMAVREGLPPERFLDLWFSDTISKPLAEIEKIYDFAGMQLTQATHQAMAEWQQHNRRELRPPHDYTLEQFGLSEDGLKAMFVEYRDWFILGR